MHCVSKKTSPFHQYDNFTKCKHLETIFGRNIADGNWNELTMATFSICSLCVISIHRKLTPIFSENSDVAFQTFCDDNIEIEVIFSVHESLEVSTLSRDE